MEVKTVRATIDKATGQVLKEQVLAVNEIDETTYYRPLVEIFGKRILEEMQNSKKRGEMLCKKRSSSDG